MMLNIVHLFHFMLTVAVAQIEPSTKEENIFNSMAPYCT